MFISPLVLKTFEAHWTAIAGARKLDGINDVNLPVGKPIGGLSLVAAAISVLTYYKSTLIRFLFQVELILTLVCNGVITIEVIAAANGK